MAVLTSSPSPPPQACLKISKHHHSTAVSGANFLYCLSRPASLRSLTLCSQLSNHQTEAPPINRVDKSSLIVSEASSEAELWAACRLRVRTFYDFNELTFGIEDHKKHLAEREFVALKERVAGQRLGFRRVSCINASLPLSAVQSVSHDLCTSFKFSHKGEDRMVVGTLDLNQCISLPNEIMGTKPQGIGADFARAYISNVCVANELQRNGLGYELLAMSKIVAEDWGISDLYVHVAVDNEAAKSLYLKSGFTLESDEPAWQARFLDRPRRLLLWTGLPITYDL